MSGRCEKAAGGKISARPLYICHLRTFSSIFAKVYFYTIRTRRKIHQNGDVFRIPLLYAAPVSRIASAQGKIIGKIIPCPTCGSTVPRFRPKINQAVPLPSIP